ncbi:MAG: hypothetical protein ICV74_07585 [Thermoleophilia bacterium]|nr:hypothetical protein [Thermoleophilia bacterium]
MIETISPAVCGGRKRYRSALAAFALAALAAAAASGAALGLVGSLLARTEACLAAALLAALAALRELGVSRIRFPEPRRQVPERWHATLPLPAWTTLYGGALGLGFLTYQPVSTFWVAGAAALALGRPGAGAACFALYGAGRAAMIIVPASRSPCPTAAVDRLAPMRARVVRGNAVALAGAAVALALAPAAAGEPIELGAGSQLDPSFSRGALAYTQWEDGVARVVVRSGGLEQASFSGRSPSLDGQLLAYADEVAVRVVRWSDGAELVRIPGGRQPALSWPRVVYRVDLRDGVTELRLRDLVSGAVDRLARVGAERDVGRPAASGTRIAWTVTGSRFSRVVLFDALTGARVFAARTRIGNLLAPALSGERVAWVDQRQRTSYLRVRVLGAPRVATIARTRRRAEAFWTTALAGRTAYVTRWRLLARETHLERVRF